MIDFTRDGFATLATRLAELGTRRALLLVGPSRRHVEPALAGAGGVLAGVVFDGARVHVPVEVGSTADAAAARLRESEADTLVAIGGGSTIGLGKALRLAHDVKFAAVPTTYAGSEMTSMYGVTRGKPTRADRPRRARQAGRRRLRRGARARHADRADGAEPAQRVRATSRACNRTRRCTQGGTAPRNDALRALEDSADGAALARRARVCRAGRIRRAPPRSTTASPARAAHALAHLLGGALRLDHGALHAVLLKPQFLAHLRGDAVHESPLPSVLAALEDAVDRRDLDSYIHDLLVRAGAPVSLTALGATADGVRAALATRPELPAQIALDALTGLRPPGRHGRIELGSAEALVLGCPLDRAARASCSCCTVAAPRPARSRAASSRSPATIRTPRIRRPARRLEHRRPLVR